MVLRINKKKERKKQVSSFKQVLRLTPIECETARGRAQVLFSIWSESQGRSSTKNWRPLRSLLSFFFLKKKTKQKKQIPFLSRFDSVFFHPLVAYRLHKHSRCSWGLKVQQRSPSHPTHSVEVILDFLFFLFPQKHNSVSFKTFSPWERKEQSVILCNNNNKKNYCPLSRKKRKESVAAHFCQMACGGGRRLSEGERCKHLHEESLRAAGAPADPGPLGAISVQNRV